MSRVQDAVDALAKIELFQGLDRTQLAKIAVTSEWHDFIDGDT